MALGTFTLIDDKFGRKVIYSAVPDINENNILDELDKALLVHNQNVSNITYLEDYYTGNQPIFSKTNDTRPEINNIICQNHAYEDVEFMVGQECGEPIQYVSKGTEEATSQKVQKLNNYMAYENKSYWDAELSRWKHICGTSYRMCYPDKWADLQNDECPFMIEVPKPRDTFIVYSSGLGKKPLMGVYKILTEELADRIQTLHQVYYCYTPKFVYTVTDGVITDTQPNGIGLIPIVEYPNNSRRMGTLELVISLYDAINMVQSNRLDGVEQFVQALMIFENCQIDKDKFILLREEGAISVKGEPNLPAKVYYIGEQLDQEQTQVLLKALYDARLSILGMPSREQNTGGDTGSAVYLRNGWDFAEKRAELNEKPIEKAEKDFLKIALKILSVNGIVDLKISDIDIKFTRSKSDNMVVKTQALLQQQQAGVHPLIALKTCELYPDPEDVYLKSKDTMEAKYATAKQPEPTTPVKPVTQTGGEPNAGA